MNPKELVVLGWGNASRGDDALGPMLCDWIELSHPGIEVFQDYQLQVEHALDLDGRRLALFVDAEVAPPDAEPGFSFRRIASQRDASHTTHALSAPAVLAVFEQVRGTAAPPAFLLGLRGQSFELGEAPSEFAQRSLELAQDFVGGLLAAADAAAWERLARRS